MNDRSYVYRSVLMPSLIFGVPRNWFALSIIFYLIPYNFGSALYGILCYMAAIVFGFLLSRFFDPDFANIIVEKLKYITLRRVKIYYH